jgi:hypothetical protein
MLTDGVRIPVLRLRRRRLCSSPPPLVALKQVRVALDCALPHPAAVRSPPDLDANAHHRNRTR